MVCGRIVEEGIPSEACADLPALLAGISSGAGAAVVAEEALSLSPLGAERLLAALAAQEPWSDIPVLLLSEATSRRRPSIVPALFERANVTLLQRPLAIEQFMSTVRSAVRARDRQYLMRDLYRELERAVQLSDMFVGILGHDLRTPLGAIRLSAQALARSGETPREKGRIDRILRSTDRMTRMIDQLLDFARVRQGRGIPLSVGRVHLGELCRHAVREVGDAHPEAILRVHETGDAWGTWDADRLTQVVTNLVGNAVQHGTAGTPVTVEVDGTKAALVRLRVHNFGAIPQEALPNLFEAFKRAAAPSATAASKTGLGLGLFIAREIARAHGGEIAVETTGERTIFEITLPRATAAEPRS
jgi:signal transduction histidine kinase